MARYAHKPLLDKMYTPEVIEPPGDGIRPLTIMAPCSCGSGHEWAVTIPPGEWKTVFYLGQLEAAGAEPVNFTETSQDPLA